MKNFCAPNITKGNPSFSVQTLGKFPEIPVPSSQLQDLLCQYHQSDTETSSWHKRSCSKSKEITKRKKRRIRRRINGFIAFRSFYSKSIKGTAHQRDLSSKLGEIWENEPSHHVWHSYALQYNATGGENNFVEWLNQKLGFVTPVSDLKILKTYKHVSLKNVEDIFMDDSDISR